MKFFKKTDDYERVYSKREARKMLIEDSRVQKVVNGTLKMTIHTKPIVPKGFRGDGIFIYPIGTYKIIIRENPRSLGIRVTRKERALSIPRLGSHHPHICNDFRNDDEFSDKICWGNVYLEVQTIKKNKDWYWLVKIILDLLCNFNEGKSLGIKYQMDFMKDNKKAMKRLNKLFYGEGYE